MSTKKRPNGPDDAVEGTGEIHSNSLPKKTRLSSIIEVDKDGRPTEPDGIRKGTYKPSSVPTQPFRLHHRLDFVSDGTRPSSGNKRAAYGQPRPRQVRTLSSSDSVPYPKPSPNSFPYSGSPQLFDVAPGLPHAVPPAHDEMGYWKTEHAAFIKSAAGLSDASWIGKRPLGSGTFGTAGLWERRDDNNVIIEQIVVKESKTTPVEKWTGEVPEEVKMMRRMNKTDCEAVPDLIAYKRYKHVRKHRIYMEFCPYNDLATLSLNYKRFRTYLPEPFLWHTFNSLVQVAAAMKKGPEDADWGYQIVHRDLKPANIFLGVEDENSGYPLYPTAKTGDWGLAQKVMPDDHQNPVGLRGAGTRAYYAPEQRILKSGEALRDEMARHLDGTAPLPKLSAHTNIWGIGAIMFELLTNEAVVLYLSDEEWTLNEAFQQIPNVRNPRYSSALTELIRLCLMPEPWDRPSIEELELKIGVRCQSVTDELAANPSLHQQDRLYYKGSEINQMPPGDWNYWNPVREYVLTPSEDPFHTRGPKNPFTDSIVYPHFPTSEMDDHEEEGGESQDGDDDDEDGRDEDGDEKDEDDKILKGPVYGGTREVIVISDDRSSGPSGNTFKNPIIVSNSDEENEGEESSEDNGVNESDGSKGSEGTESSDGSDGSDVRRRMAMKKLPGT